MKKITFPNFSILLFLCLLCNFMTAQIPNTQGLPLKWQYLFDDPSTNPPNTDVYPEDYLVDALGNLHFLHNTGLLEGSLITTLNGAGGLQSVVSNRLDNLGFRLIGMSLEQINQTAPIRMLGMVLFSNNVLAIPPAGKFAFTDINNGVSSLVVPSENTVVALRSRNDRGLPWPIRINDGNYLVVEPFVTTDTQFVAVIRKASGTTAIALDTLDKLQRPMRNGTYVGFSGFHSIRGIGQLTNGQYAFLHSQPGSPPDPDTSEVAVVLALFDAAGHITKTCDLSAVCGYSTYPKMICKGGKIYVYGIASAGMFVSPNVPYSNLVILDEAGNIEWSGKISDSFGNDIPFREIAVSPNGDLLLINDLVLSNGEQTLRLYKWGVGDPFAEFVGEVLFNDNTTRMWCTSLFFDAVGDVVAMFQIDKYNIPPLPIPTELPNNIFHAALSVTAASLGLVSSQESGPLLQQASIYPNPTDGLIYVNGLPEGKAYTFDVYDAVGSRKFTYNLTGDRPSIQIESFTAGIYFLMIRDNTGSISTFKIIKQ